MGYLVLFFVVFATGSGQIAQASKFSDFCDGAYERIAQEILIQKFKNVAPENLRPPDPAQYQASNESNPPPEGRSIRSLRKEAAKKNELAKILAEGHLQLSGLILKRFEEETQIQNEVRNTFTAKFGPDAVSKLSTSLKNETPVEESKVELNAYIKAASRYLASEKHHALFDLGITYNTMMVVKSDRDYNNSALQLVSFDAILDRKPEFDRGKIIEANEKNAGVFDLKHAEYEGALIEYKYSLENIKKFIEMFPTSAVLFALFDYEAGPRLNEAKQVLMDGGVI